MTLDVIDGDLWQWDTGREAEVVGCDQVHFAKSTTGTCYTVEVAGGKAKIPDELLQAAGRMYAWAYITDEVPGGRTRIEAIWDVRRRAKPAGYIYEPADRNTIKDAETARDEAKAAQKAAEAARDRAVAAEVKGARAMTLASGSDATAAMEGNVLVVGVPKGDALRYSDLTAEQIAELKKPATDAAAAVSKVNDEFKQLKASAETAEKGRADAEGGRRRAEEMRGTSEAERDTAEKARERAETSRANDERARVSAESSRSSAEDERTSAESAREQAEAKRSKAEEQRAQDSKTRLGELAQAKTDAEAATGEVNTARDEAKKAAKAAADASSLAASSAAGADDAADKALSASTSANSAASSASSAAASAESAASKADSAANEARSATTKANASVITNVDVTSLDPGSEATVSIVKGESGQALTLGIPRGAKGDAGAKGDPFTYDDFTEDQIRELRRPATEAATRADAAAKAASDAAGRVDASIESANTAVENANSAAAGATIAKDAANTAAKKASTAGDNVLAAKAEADSAASKANAAATKANTAGDSALTAKAKADSAASEASAAASKAESAASSANNAASGLANIKKQATDAATKANNAADRVDASITSAKAAAATANESAASANTATESAKAATASANDATDRLTTLEGQVASNESARASAEESRASAETARANAESARAESESARSSAETSRAASEQARAKAEKARSDADAQRETRQLKNDADQAQNNAAARGFTYHLCGEGEYAPDSVDGEHNVPTVDGEAGVMYLTPKVDGASDEDAYDQWLFVGSKWELVGSSGVAHVDPVTTDDIDGISGGGTVTADRYLNATGLSYAWRKLTSGVSTDIETAVAPVSKSVNDLNGKLSETKSVSDSNKSRIDTMESTVTGNSESIEAVVNNVADNAKRLDAVTATANGNTELIGTVKATVEGNTKRISALETKVGGMGTGGTGGASVRAGGQDLSVVLADKISASGGTVYSVLHELVASEDFSNIMVGDYLDVKVAGTTATSDSSVRFAVAHINPYKGVGKFGTASHIALVSAQPLKVSSYHGSVTGGSYLLWNSSNTNNSSSSGGYPYTDSALRKWETSLYTDLPYDFTQYAIDREAYLEKRYGSSGDSTGNSWKSIEGVWSLSEKEVFGCDVFGTKGYSVGADVQFDLFRSGDALTGGKMAWWLRTVAGGSTTKACYVDSTGAPMAKDATGSYVRPRVALLFG